MKIETNGNLFARNPVTFATASVAAGFATIFPFLRTNGGKGTSLTRNDTLSPDVV